MAKNQFLKNEIIYRSWTFLALMFCSIVLTAQTTWTGATDSNWNLASNWSDGIPDDVQDVTIPNVATPPTILAGTVALANSIFIQSNASLTIENTGSLTINGFRPLGGFDTGLRNVGTVNNHGDIIIGSLLDVGQFGIYNEGVFNNNSGGFVSIDRSNFVGFANFSLVNNASTINIGSITNIGTRGINNQGTFNNISGGQITIDRSITEGAIINFNDFTNSGSITIGAIGSVGSYGIFNVGNLINNLGGDINIDRSNIRGVWNSGTGTFTNAANINIGATASVGAEGVRNQSTLTNNGTMISTLVPFQNLTTGIYQGTGTFEGNFNNGGSVQPGII